MMANFEAFASVLVLILLVLAVRGPWKSVCTDYARQVMFECRDAIFDLAREGKISFESTAYKQARLGIERNIRFAHEISVGRLVFYYSHLSRADTPLPTERAVGNVGDYSVRTAIESQVATSQRVLLFLMIAKSPMLMIFVGFLILLSRANEKARTRLQEVMRRLARWVQAESDNDPRNGFDSAKAA